MWQKSARYLDSNAGAGLDPYVRKKLIEILQTEEFFFANPSSRHRLGQKVQQHLYFATETVAKCVQAQANQLIFTSSGTEANQTVIQSCRSNHDAWVVGGGEHSSTYDYFLHLPKTAEVSLLADGSHDWTALRDVLEVARTQGRKKVFLSLTWVNHETGVITDLAVLRQVIQSSGLEVTLHLDAAQAWGKIALDFQSSPAQFVTLSGHKIGAPAGTGVIWARNPAQLHPLIQGSQGNGLRGGTENVLGILGLGYAAEKVDPLQYQSTVAPLRNEFENALLDSGILHRVWGKEALRVANTSRISFLNFKTYQNWVELLDLRGFAVSHGSACKSKVVEPSRVLLQMGAAEGEALNSIRVSFSASVTKQDGIGLVHAIREIHSLKTSEARP